MKRAFVTAITFGAALVLAGCASEGGLLGSSGATSSTAALPPKPAVDPGCAALASQIDQLRKDGVVERVEAASKGKGSTVSVKRDSLGKMAQLEKVNAEFQAKCSSMPRTASAAPAPATPAPAAAQAAAAVAAPAAKTAAVKAAATAAKQ